MPTFAEVASATYPSEFRGDAIPPMAGQSLLPILQGKPYMREAPIYWNWRNGKAIRDGPYRLVSDRDEPWELYDMRVDKTETHDLASRHPDIVQRLDARYRSWAGA